MKPEIKKAHMRAACDYAALSKCTRRKVGCVLVKNENPISFGYNGTPPQWNNECEDCNGNTLPEVRHAEFNAIIKLAKYTGGAQGSSLFVTTAPCFDCAELIAAAGIVEVYYTETYRTTEGIEYLEKHKIYVEQISDLS